MPAKITIRGARETAAALRAVGRQSTQRGILNSALRPGANHVKANVQAEVAAKALIDTGEYRRSIAVRVGRKNRYGETARVYVGVRGPRRFISHLLEFGTRFAAARPHFRPALDRSYTEVVRLFGKAVWPQIERAVLRNAVRVARRSVR